jgi:hypothetical protein
MASISLNASPRCYRRHQRHMRFTRMRRSGQMAEFLIDEAARLSSTEAAIYKYLYVNKASTIRSPSVTTTGQLVAVPAGLQIPTDPDPA